MMKKLQRLATYMLMSICIVTNAQDLKIYVSDAENFAPGSGTIYQYDIDGSNSQVFIDEELSWPQDIVFLADKNEVLISNLNSNKITRYNATTGAYIDDFAAVAGGPTRMKIGSDGLLYVIQWSATDNNVLRFQLDGTPLGEYTDTGVSRSIGFDWDASGNLYVSSFSQANVTQFDSNGMSATEFIDNTELSGPTNIFFNDDGELFVFDWNAGDVERYDSSGMHQETFITGVGQVEGVDFLPNGNILLAHGSDASVKQYLEDGTFVETTVPSGSGGLQQPNAVILFDRSTLGNDEFEFSNSVLVTPSVGTEFTILESIYQKADKVSIYSASGKLISQFNDVGVWDASKVAEGMYFIVAEIRGIKTTQKIIVQK